MTQYVVLSAILFTIGCVGVLTRRNAIVVFMCVELMLNACNLAFVAFARQHGNLEGQITAFFVMVGYSHALMPFEEIAREANWLLHVPRPLSLFIGFAEIAGGLGVILPSLTRVAPWLTPLAALGLATIMILAILFHLVRGEASVVPIPALMAAFALFVAWGRWSKRPTVAGSQTA